ncbi:MAG: Gfo/Idh/MocA family oxidoreductase [Candidatus Dormibacteraeota bacterium]|nr:Gfo/Idh/MocA family oxidoreductase [Candidatus Dormibacteraeota bacterium]
MAVLTRDSQAPASDVAELRGHARPRHRPGGVAVVGLGYWGPKLLRNLTALMGDEDVIAIDSDAARLMGARKQYPWVRSYTSLEAALEGETIGAVVIATPAKTHAALARTALEAGCGVLVEKPLASSVAEAREIVNLAASREQVLMVAHTFLFSRRVEWLARFIRNGELGAIHYATSSRLNLGLHRPDVNVIWDLAPHDFSILFHLLSEFPVRLQTSGRSLVKGGGCDVAFINMTFPSGVVSAIDVSWMSPKKIRNTVIVGDSRMAVYDDTDNEAPVQIYDRGIAALDSADFGSNQLTYRYGDTIHPYIAPDEPLSVELSHFLDCIRRGQRSISDGLFGLRVVEALEAAEESRLRGGVPVELQHTVATTAEEFDDTPAVRQAAS